MSELKKICPKCNAINKPNAITCIDCGASMRASASLKKPPVSATPQRDGDARAQKVIEEFTFTAKDKRKVTSDQMNRFIDTGSDKILPKLIQMEKSGSKVSWHWPMFALTFFLGLNGAAFWFFYRKMTSKGIFCMAFNLLLLVLLTTLEVILGVGLSLVSTLLSIVLSIILPMYVLDIYKNHCIESILKISSVSTGEAANHVEYKEKGGAAFSSPIIAAVIYLVAYMTVAKFITYIVSLIMGA